MKIEIRESKDRLTYKVDGRELPMNSAIREYKHPSDIDKEGWRDLINESNGDVLKVTYIGTETGFNQAIARAPKASKTFLMSFVNIYDLQIEDFQRSFKKWLTELKSSKAYNFANNPSLDDMDLNILRAKQHGPESVRKLSNIGFEFLHRLMPEKSNNDVTLEISSHKQAIRKLSAEKKSLELMIKKNQKEKELKKNNILEQSEATIQSIEDKLTEEFVITVSEIERQLELTPFKEHIDVKSNVSGNSKVINSLDDKKIDGQMINKIKSIFEDFRAALNDISSEIDMGSSYLQSIERILKNVSTGKAQVANISLENVYFQNELFSRETAKALKQSNLLIENSNLNGQSVVTLLAGNAIRLTVYLAQVVLNQMIANIQDLQSRQILLIVEKEHQWEKERQGLKQRLAILDQQIIHENILDEWLSSILELKRSIPVMPDLEEKNEI